MKPPSKKDTNCNTLVDRETIVKDKRDEVTTNRFQLVSVGQVIRRLAAGDENENRRRLREIRRHFRDSIKTVSFSEGLKDERWKDSSSRGRWLHFA